MLKETKCLSNQCIIELDDFFKLLAFFSHTFNCYLFLKYSPNIFTIFVIAGTTLARKSGFILPGWGSIPPC